MSIQNYLDEVRMKNVDFANKIRRHPSYISRLKKKEKVPSLLTALIIFKESDGYINVGDLLTKTLLSENNLIKEDGSVLVEFVNK